MELPEIGETVTTIQAVELCQHFGLDYLVERISQNMDGYESWRFDGCSMLPDRLIGFLIRRFWKQVVLRAALPHDLAYAYGEPGNEGERALADIAFHNRLKNAGMWEWLASKFYYAVRVGGAEEFMLSFTWAFARAGEIRSRGN